MARIRSIHPGLTSDEAFMAMSLPAKLVWMLLWTDCDDQGLFEWKPIAIKARLLPADSIDITPLLDEFVALKVVLRFEVDGKPYGAVKNFQRYQRPKSPKKVYPLPEEILPFVDGTGHGSAVTDDVMTFTRDVTAAERQARRREKQSREKCDGDGNGHGSDGDIGGNRHGSAVTDSTNRETVTLQTLPFPGNGEESRQMEDGGCNKKELSRSRRPSASEHPSFAEFWKTYPRRDGPNPRKPAATKFTSLCSSGIDPETLIAAAAKTAADYRRGGQIGTRFVPRASTWLNEARWEDHSAIASSAASGPEIDWDRKLLGFTALPAHSRVWYGPGSAPGDAGCLVPAEIQRKYGFTPVPWVSRDGREYGT